jgi:hypothetical protein
MPHADNSSQEDEVQTEIFLNTNGPDETELEPSIPPDLLRGKSESEKWLYEQADKSIKQNNWLIRQVTGLKRAHRVAHQRMDEVKADLKVELEKGTLRFQSLDQKIEPLHALWNKWLTRKKLMWNALLGLLSLFLLPFLALFAVEAVKHWLGWK